MTKKELISASFFQIEDGTVRLCYAVKKCLAHNKGITLNFNSLIISAIFSAVFLTGGFASKSLYMQNSSFFKDFAK